MWAYSIYLHYNVGMTLLMVVSSAINTYRFFEPTLRYSRNPVSIGRAIGAIISGTITTSLVSASLAVLMIKTLSVMLGVFVSSGLWDVVA